MSALLELLTVAGSSLIKLLLGRWLNKDPEKEALKNALESKELEAEALAKPDMSEPDIMRELRRHEKPQQ